MKISHFPNQTALQSEPIWKAFLSGCLKNNLSIEENSMDCDLAVIWSVLWHGRLKSNQQVYDHYRSQNKPVFIIEVGALDRGKTWKISVNHINSTGIYPKLDQLDINRPSKLNLTLKPKLLNRNPQILIATQHQYSLQWKDLPNVSVWTQDLIRSIRNYSDRDIVVRPHPRCPINVSMPGVVMQYPMKILNTYDRYDLKFNYHCVINYSSGPSIQSVISGTPIITSSDSLAFPMSTQIEHIENPILPDREDWFLNICHTEWTIEEIKLGIPQRLLLNQLN